MRRDHVELTLRDGTAAWVRPIRPEDKELLRRGIEQLSAQTRYLRFHSPTVDLSDEQLAYLTEVDHRDHLAWAAVDAEGEGMGVARCVRLADEPSVAEAAITIADRWQGRGLGSRLWRVLGCAARLRGMTTLRSYVLEENAPMLAILDRLGGEVVPDAETEPGVARVDLVIPDPPRGLDVGAVARLLDQAERRAAGRSEPGAGWGPLMKRRPHGDPHG